MIGNYMDQVHIIIAQKNEAVGKQLADFLTVAGMTVVGNVRSFPELETIVKKWKPHIVLIDIQYAENDFPGFLKKLKEMMPQAKVALMGPEPEDCYAQYTAVLGAHCYLSEGSPPHEWLRKLWAIAHGGKKESFPKGSSDESVHGAIRSTGQNGE